MWPLCHNIACSPVDLTRRKGQNNVAQCRCRGIFAKAVIGPIAAVEYSANCSSIQIDLHVCEAVKATHVYAKQRHIQRRRYSDDGSRTSTIQPGQGGSTSKQKIPLLGPSLLPPQARQLPKLHPTNFLDLSHSIAQQNTYSPLKPPVFLPSHIQQDNPQDKDIDSNMLEHRPQPPPYAPE